jgi:nicotinamide riboside kinase
MAKIVQLYGGPGAGKSTTAMRLAADLKAAGYNAEYVQENVKNKAWEKRSAKYFNAQDLIFAKQHWDVDIVATEVDIVVTDSPILMSMCYIPDNFKLPTLKKVIREAHDSYESLNIFMKRGAKPYNPNGRNQTKEEAIAKDREIYEMLVEQEIDYIELVFDYEKNAKLLIEMLKTEGWLK